MNDSAFAKKQELGGYSFDGTFLFVDEDGGYCRSRGRIPWRIVVHAHKNSTFKFWIVPAVGAVELAASVSFSEKFTGFVEFGGTSITAHKNEQ